jgi:hypothetical protein
MPPANVDADAETDAADPGGAHIRSPGLPPFSLAHFTALTCLTEVQLYCGATVESYAPLAALPELRKLAVLGATLAPPPILPPLPTGCEVFMYFHRSLGDGSTLARLPPLTGVHCAFRHSVTISAPLQTLICQRPCRSKHSFFRATRT